MCELVDEKEKFIKFQHNGNGLFNFVCLQPWAKKLMFGFAIIIEREYLSIQKHIGINYDVFSRAYISENRCLCCTRCVLLVGVRRVQILSNVSNEYSRTWRINYSENTNYSSCGRNNTFYKKFTSNSTGNSIDFIESSHSICLVLINISPLSVPIFLFQTFHSATPFKQTNLNRYMKRIEAEN